MQRQSSSMLMFAQRSVWTLGALLLLAVLLQFIHFPTERVFFVLFTAFVLSSAIAPAVSFLETKRVPRTWGILLVYVLALAILAGIIGLMVPLFASEISTLSVQLPNYLAELQQRVTQINPQAGRALTLENLGLQISHSLSSFANHATTAVSGVLGVGVATVLVLVVTFFATVEQNLVARAVSSFAPLQERERVCEIVAKIEQQIGHWARAQLLLAAFFGVAFGLGLRLAGVPFSFTIGLVGAVLEIIPYVGGFITLVLALMVALTKAPLLAVFVGIWYFIVVELEGHVIAPKLFDKFLGIHPLAVVIALFIGGETLGVMGALLSIPVAIIIKVLIDERTRAAKQEVEAEEQRHERRVRRKHAS